MIIPGARNRPLRKVVGCTMAGPGYMGMAAAARESFEAVTGLPCVLAATPTDDNYRCKFDLHHRFDDDQTVIYFDADTRWVRAFNPSLITRDFGMVLDPGRYNPDAFPMYDCEILGMPQASYGNSGVMIFGSAHRPVWETCNRLWDKITPRLRDFGEQSLINYTLQILGVKRFDLHDDWNFAPVCINSGRPQNASAIPHLVHAMGYRHQRRGKRLTDKEACLNMWEGRFILEQP